MDSLAYLFSLGFSGSDAVRAIFFLLIGSLFVTKRLPPWRVTTVLLALDLAWPYAMMLLQGNSFSAVGGALQGAMHFHEDAVIGFLVRAAGFYVVLRGTFSIRRRLQAAFPDDGSKSRLMPF